MSWKCLSVVLLAGTILGVHSTETQAGLLKSKCGAVAGGCGVYAESCTPCAPVYTAPYVAPAPVMTKVKVMEYHKEEYEATVKVCKTFTKDEPYTVYKCETVPMQKKVMVTYCKVVPKVIDTVVTKCEYVNVPVDVVVTKCEWVTVMEDRTVMHCTYEPMEEMRDVTQYVAKTVPVTGFVSKCVDKGGHYECREVACSTASHHGLFRHHGSECDPCAPPPVSLVSVYVPNYVTEQVPVTTYKTICEPVTTKVKVVTYKRVEKPEVVKVAVCKLVETKVPTKVMQCKLVETKVPTKVTVYENVYEPKEEMVTYYESKMVPVTMVRKVCYTAMVDEKVKAYKWVGVEVEKEVAVYPTTGCSDCGASYVSDCGGCKKHHLSLFRH